MPLTLAVELSSNQLFVIILMGMALIVSIIVAMISAFNNGAKLREREQSRRELAAYVAEGSMTADEAERILRAGAKKDAADVS